MEIDILKLAAIITALSVIFGVIIGGYKMYDKLIDNNKELERRIAKLAKQNQSINKESALIIYALGACLNGLHQQGCNGEVTEAMNKINSGGKARECCSSQHWHTEPY